MDMQFLIATIVGTIVFAVAAPVIGCLIDGADRIISARMQGRVGPKLLQPYWDVRKLLGKDKVAVSGSEDTYINLSLFFALLAGGIFFSGGNFLLVVFVITLSSLFFIVAAYSTRSPYAEVGASRETLQVMAYEPMILFMAVAYYQVTGTFDTAGVTFLSHPVICIAFAVFLGLLFVKLFFP